MEENIFSGANFSEIKVLTPEDFSSVLGGSLSVRLEAKVRELNIQYRNLTQGERDDCIRAAIKILLDPEMDRSGEHRLDRWERGWSENLAALKERGESGLLPAYFSVKRDLVKWSKWRQEYIKPLKEGFDYKILSVILEWLFERYAVDVGSVYEFGCGTGHHLLRLREINKTAKIYGLDWAEASQKIIAEMVASGMAQNIYGKKFDFFNPDRSFILDKNSAVYTVGALEQVGEKHEKFIDYLISNKPKICFHVEPIGEVLDESNLIDCLAKEYYKKRNYLTNFVGHLKALEKEGKVDIKQVQRSYLGGSLLTEYVIVVWSPKGETH